MAAPCLLATLPPANASPTTLLLPLPPSPARLRRQRAGSYRELQQRQERAAKLGGLAQQMAYDKAVMSDRGRKRKLRPEEAGGQAGVFRWKAERKR